MFQFGVMPFFVAVLYIIKVGSWRLYSHGSMVSQ